MLLKVMFSMNNAVIVHLNSQAVEEGARLLTEAKGSYGHGLGEERCSLLSPIIGFRDYSESLSANGQPKPKAIRKNADGQYIAEVFPTG